MSRGLVLGEAVTNEYPRQTTREKKSSKRGKDGGKRSWEVARISPEVGWDNPFESFMLTPFLLRTEDGADRVRQGEERSLDGGLEHRNRARGSTRLRRVDKKGDRKKLPFAYDYVRSGQPCLGTSRKYQ